MPNVEEAKQRLWAKAQFRTCEKKLTPRCKDMMKQLIEYAVDNLYSNGFEPDEDHLVAAEISVERFVAEMIIKGRRFGFKRLDENTFAAAKYQLSPLWPVC